MIVKDYLKTHKEKMWFEIFVAFLGKEVRKVLKFDDINEAAIFSDMALIEFEKRFVEDK